MDDDTFSLVSSTEDEEDLLKTFQVVPKTAGHFKVLIFRSEQPFQLKIDLDHGDVQMKEVKSHFNDEDCRLSNNSAFRHIGTTVDGSLAKAIWDTINCHDTKQEATNTVVASTPIATSSRNSSFDVIGDYEDACDQDLPRVSVDNSEQSSAISEASSFRQINESEDETEELVDYEDTSSDEERPKNQPTELDKVLSKIGGSTRMASKEYLSSEDSNKLLPLQMIEENLWRMKMAAEMVRSNHTKSAASTAAQIHQLRLQMASSPSASTEPRFHILPEVQGRKSENLILLVLEYMGEIVDSLRRSDPVIDMFDVSVNYFNRILDCKAFMELSEEQIDELLNIKQNEPKIEDDDVYRWAEYLPPSSSDGVIDYRVGQRGAFKKYLDKVRLSSPQEPQTLAELSRVNFIHAVKTCRKSIDSHKKELLFAISNRKPVTSSREPLFSHDYLYILTHDTIRSWENHIYQINLQTKKPEKIASRQAILLASLQNCLFVFARRSITQRSIDVYKFSTKEWTTMNNWPSDLVISSMCTYNRCIYFIASIGSTHNFYKYNPSINEFKMILPPSLLSISDNEKIIPYKKNILFLPSGFAYNVIKFSWENFAKFEPRFSTSILAVHHDRIIFPFGNDLLRWFDPKTGNHGCHSNWYNSSGKNGHLIDLTVINDKFYLLEKCVHGVNLMCFNGQSWTDLGKIDLHSEPLRCAISTDNF